MFSVTYEFLQLEISLKKVMVVFVCGESWKNLQHELRTLDVK